MYKIFLVEDDETIAKMVKNHLEKWVSEVRIAQKFDRIMAGICRFRAAACPYGYRVCRFDNGYHWCTQIRESIKCTGRIFVFSGRQYEYCVAVTMGADDFIAKPFDMQVLTVKIQAILRRSYDFAGNSSVLEHRGAMLNISEAELSYEGESLELTKNELKILQTLFENKASIVTRDTLMTKLWESDTYVDENTLSVNVNRLRKKLASIGLSDFIITKKGIGYKLG